MQAQRSYLLFSAYFLAPSAGGGATFSREIVAEWLKLGRKVNIICANFNEDCANDFRFFISSGQLKLHPAIPSSEIAFGHQINEALTIFTKTLIDLEKPDFVHIHNFQGLLSGVSAAVTSGVPTVYTALDFGMTCITWYLYHGENEPCSGPEKEKCQECCLRTNHLRAIDFPIRITQLLRRLLHKEDSEIGLRDYFNPQAQNYWRRHAVASHSTIFSLIKNFSAILAPSPPVYEQILQHRGYANGIFQILYPVSNSKICRKESNLLRASQNIRMIFLGHAHKIKGWHFFLSVLESLPDDLPLEVWDAGGNQALFRNSSPLVKRYLKKCQRFSSDQVAKLIGESDMVLVPSLWHENSPLVVLESLANGTPVFASAQKGITHLVRDGHNGILAKPGDAESWRTKLIECLKTPDIIRAMKRNCHYSRDSREYVHLLEEIELSLPLPTIHLNKIIEK